MNFAHNIPQIMGLLRQNKLPGQLVIQLADHCNAHCPQCGMRVNQKFPRSKLSIDTVKRMLDAAAQRGIVAVSFTGGEPLIFLAELAELIRYAGQVGIQHIRTGTNGFQFLHSDKPQFASKINRIAETLAQTPLKTFWISIDAAIPSVHEHMRGFPQVIQGIEQALPIFHEHGLYPAANLGINRNIGGETTMQLSVADDAQTFYQAFRHALRQFYNLIIDLGFTIANCCYPMSIDNEVDSLKSVYAATSLDSVIKFTPMEKKWLFKSLFDTIPEFRDRIRIFSPLISLYVLQTQYEQNHVEPYPCRGGIDFFYIDAKEGNTYPCGYRGEENLGKFWQLNHQNRSQHSCYRCEWECFRDPSELLGPLPQLFSEPMGLYRKFKQEQSYFKLWFNDLKYYWACDFFDGRKPPNYRRLARFHT